MIDKDTTKEYKSVFFVQPTKDSDINKWRVLIWFIIEFSHNYSSKDSGLKKIYEETIRKSECPVKVAERACTNIKRKLQKSYPFGEERCNSGECFSRVKKAFRDRGEFSLLSLHEMQEQWLILMTQNRNRGLK